LGERFFEREDGLVRSLAAQDDARLGDREDVGEFVFARRYGTAPPFSPTFAMAA
jgi:hypothetical protein